jgi:hypothetical protein
MLQLQFYSLNKTDSKLRDTIPSLVASGVVLPEDMDYKVQSWDGSGEFPVVLEAQSIGKKRQRDISELDKSECRTKLSETEFARVSIHKNDGDEDSELPESKSCNGQSAEKGDDPIFWPYIVHKRCDGSNMEHVCVSPLTLSLVIHSYNNFEKSAMCTCFPFCMHAIKLICLCFKYGILCES